MKKLINSPAIHKIPGVLQVLVRWLSLAVVMLALSWWSWKMFGPTPRSVLPYVNIPPRATLVDPVVAAHLFGEPPAPVLPAVSPLPAIVVKAVFAELGSAPGYAIMTIDGQLQVVRVKTEIRPGIVLEKVGPQSVEFVREGQAVTVMIEAGKPPASITVVK